MAVVNRALAFECFRLIINHCTAYYGQAGTLALGHWFVVLCPLVTFQPIVMTALTAR
jgi:hypothetical protein